MHLYHDNIIRLYDAFQYESFFIMIFEYCPNGTLCDLIGNEGISGVLLVQIIYQIANALLYMHEMNYAHCDLKPQNILIDNYGRLKLSDFGLTCFQEEYELTREFKGTLLYTPPEILRKVPHNKIKADIWSLGILIIVLATGQIPWSHAQGTKYMTKEILNGLYTIKKEIPCELKTIIKNTVVVKPENRMSVKDILSMNIFNICRQSTNNSVGLSSQLFRDINCTGKTIEVSHGYKKFMSSGLALARFPIYACTSTRKILTVHHLQTFPPKNILNQKIMPLGRRFS